MRWFSTKANVGIYNENGDDGPVGSKVTEIIRTAK
jgi:hypothetical protein